MHIPLARASVLFRPIFLSTCSHLLSSPTHQELATGAAAGTRLYDDASKSRVLRRKVKVKPGQMVGLQPRASRYQLAQPEAQTVLCKRSCMLRLKASWISDRTSTACTCRRSITRKQSRM